MSDKVVIEYGVVSYDAVGNPTDRGTYPTTKIAHDVGYSLITQGAITSYEIIDKEVSENG